MNNCEVKRMSKSLKRSIAVLLAVIMLLALCACGKQPAGSETTSQAAVTEAVTAQEASSETVEAAEESSEPEATTEVQGSPWVTSILTGNLPLETPDAKDDLFLHYNYDDISAHQGELYTPLTLHTDDVPNYVVDALVSGELKAEEGSGYTEAELAQLNILYQQASDLEKLASDGIAQIQPYLDKVDAAGSIEELNNVLVGEDFPFSPFLYFPVNAYDMSDVNNVFVYPELLFVDDVEGAQYYQDTDDPIVEQANKQFLSASMIPVMADLSWLGMTQDEAISAVQNICSFEKSYAKDAGSPNLYVNKEYGAFAAASENLSLDELAALCPNFPVKQTVEKFGKGKSPFYSVLSKKWMETFNTLWTDDNLDELKLVIKAKILQECEPYLDPSVQNQIKAMLGKPEIDAQSNAVNVICQNKTFAQLVSKIYAADNYSDEDTARLTDITKKLTESLKGLIDKTAWMSNSTKEQMRLKLDELNINILVPEGGYIDFSDLTLTPSEEGGSLVENYLALKAYVDAKINERIGQPAVARMLWEHISPAVINCCYDQDTNSVNILPGFLATDMYRSDMSEEELFGGIGWVIAHEISHGFDFAGSQFDAYGRGNILFGDDLKDYMAKVDQIVAYYDTIEPLKDVYVTGDTVKVEAAADLIGMQILMETVKEEEGFQYEPFFKQTAVDYCQVVPSVDVIQMLMGGDGHPLNYVRTNVNVQMFDEFYQTFDVKEGDGMYLPAEQRIKFFGE